MANEKRRSTFTDPSFIEWAEKTRRESQGEVIDVSLLVEDLSSLIGKETEEAFIERSLLIQELSRRIRLQQAGLESLTQRFQLAKQSWEYKKADPAETCCTRWIASRIAYLFPEERREEWLGDLYEDNRKMLRNDCPRWLVNVINVRETAILILSALKIKISDFLAPGQQKGE